MSMSFNFQAQALDHRKAHRTLVPFHFLRFICCTQTAHAASVQNRLANVLNGSSPNVAMYSARQVRSSSAMKNGERWLCSVSHRHSGGRGDCKGELFKAATQSNKRLSRKQRKAKKSKEKQRKAKESNGKQKAMEGRGLRSHLRRVRATTPTDHMSMAALWNEHMTSTSGAR